MATEEGNLEREYRIPLLHVFPQELVTQYAPHVTIQHNEHEFIVSFFDVIMPPIVGDDDARRELQETLESEGVHARCVARLVFPAKRYADVVEALSRNLERWREENETE